MHLHHPPSQTSYPRPQENTLTLKEAAYRARVSTDTVVRWALRYSLGHQIGGRGAAWRIDAVALEMHLARDIEALAAYLAGDRTSAAANRYREAAAQKISASGIRGRA